MFSVRRQSFRSRRATENAKAAIKCISQTAEGRSRLRQKVNLLNWARRDGEAKGSAQDMGRIRFIAICLAISAIAPMRASADDLPAQPLKPVKPQAAKPKAAKPKAAKPQATRDGSLADIPFSNPYAPPVGAGKSAGGEFPAAKTATPADPKGGVSLIYKWHASGEPTDPYWHVRNEYGPDGPGSSFQGGLKLGF
jgi:hypothetical protein